jgi:hypothetical protein
VALAIVIAASFFLIKYSGLSELLAFEKNILGYLKDFFELAKSYMASFLR